MTTDTAAPTPPERAPDTAVAAPNGDTGTSAPAPNSDAEMDDDEARLLWREGLSSDAVVLTPSAAAAPMRQRAKAIWFSC